MSRFRRGAGLAAAAVVLVSGLGPASPGAPAANAGEDGCNSSNAAPYREPQADRLRRNGTPGVPMPLRDMEVDQVWAISRGAGIKVAVVDSGVAAYTRGRGNPHLPFGAPKPGDASVAVMAGGSVLENGVKPPENTAAGATTGQLKDGIGDWEGHGTYVASIIAARRTAASDMIGLAPESVIIPIQVYVTTQAPTPDDPRLPSSSNIAKGIRLATAKGADVINLSMSAPVQNTEMRDAIKEAVAKGVVVVVSAGDKASVDPNNPSRSSDAPRYPAADAALPGLIAVGATHPNGAVDTTASKVNDTVEVVAQGQAIPVAGKDTDSCIVNTTYAASSYAVPYVSATAALIQSWALSYYGHKLSPAEVEWRITASALRANPEGRVRGAGWGSVNPLGALTIAADADVVGPALPGKRAAKLEAPPLDRAPEPAPYVDHGLRTRRLAAMLVGGGLLGVLALVLLRRLREQ